MNDTEILNSVYDAGSMSLRTSGGGSGGESDVNISQVGGTAVTDGLPTKPAPTANATRSNVTAATADTQVLAANTSRTGVLIFNDSTATMYLAYGSTAASTTSYSVQIGAGAYWEMPKPVYTGVLKAVWEAENGAARVTELE